MPHDTVKITVEFARNCSCRRTCYESCRDIMASFYFPLPNVEYGQINDDGTIQGLDVSIGSDYLVCACGEFYTPTCGMPIAVTRENRSFTWKYIDDSDNDDINDDSENDCTDDNSNNIFDEDSNNIFDEDGNWQDASAYILALSSNITLTVDTHWNCYCKTQNVCGCGCDELHDGW